MPPPRVCNSAKKHKLPQQRSGCSLKRTKFCSLVGQRAGTSEVGLCLGVGCGDAVIEVILSPPFKGALGRGSSVLTVVVVEGLAYQVVLRLKPHGVRSEPLKLYQRQLILPRDSGRSFCPLQALRDQRQCRLIWEPVRRMGHFDRELLACFI